VNNQDSFLDVLGNANNLEQFAPTRLLWSASVLAVEHLKPEWLERVRSLNNVRLNKAFEVA